MENQDDTQNSIEEKEFTEIARTVIRSFGYDPDSHAWLMGRNVEQIRKLIMYTLHVEHGLTFYMIGKIFDVHRSVVGRNINLIARRSDSDKALMAVLDKIERGLIRG